MWVHVGTAKTELLQKKRGKVRDPWCVVSQLLSHDENTHERVEGGGDRSGEEMYM